MPMILGCSRLMQHPDPLRFTSAKPRSCPSLRDGEGASFHLMGITFLESLTLKHFYRSIAIYKRSEQAYPEGKGGNVPFPSGCC
jgi:hypothetical protein